MLFLADKICLTCLKTSLLFLFPGNPSSYLVIQGPIAPVMYCLCKSNTLRQFIRNVAHVDVEPALRHGSASATFAKSRRQLSTFKALRIQHSPPRLQGAPEAEGGQSAHPASSAEGSDRPAQPLTHNPAAGPAVLEITPDIIDQLAAEAAQESAREAAREDPQPSDGEYAARKPRKRTAERPIREHQPSKPSKGRDPISLTHTTSPTDLRKTFRTRTPDESEILDRISKKFAKKEDDDWTPPPRLPWQSQKAALKEKFDEGWAPRKRLSPDALAGIRAINTQFPEQYTVPVLAAKFEVSPEAVRRILKSKWRPDEDEEEDRKQRWYKRGQQVWTRYAELGLKPPRKWRELGIGKREKGWRSKEKEEREREQEALSVTWNPRLTRKRDGDGFV